MESSNVPKTKKELIHALDGIDKSDDFSQWIKEFALSDLNDDDKMDLLKYSQPLFLKFKNEKFSKPVKTLIRLVNKDNFVDAARFSKYVSYEYDEKREDIRNIIKKRSVYIVSPKLDMEMGGLGHIVVQRANYFANEGYDTTIVNAGPIKNYNFIQKFHQKQGRLSQNVKFVNYLEYYCFKNSNGTKNPTLDADIKKSVDDLIITDGCRLQRSFNADDSISLVYLNDNDDVVKREKYIDDCLIFSQTNDFESYFTQDGFKYFEIDRTTHKVYLNERESDMTLEFKNKNQFFNYFLKQLCIRDEKPFMICDSTTHWYNMNGIRLKDAFKIGCLHGNPFVDFDPQKEIHPKINHFKRIETFDRIVLLTESTKNDLIGRVDSKYLTAIPNFVVDDFLDYDDVEKDMNKIATFSRIAPIKQISHMIKAFKLISAENDTAYLDIYGGTFTPDEEEELEMLKEMVSELDLEDRIHFKGYIDDVNSEMKKTFFTLLTSKMEGLSVSSLELMGNSTPIISYNVRYGPSDLITNNVDGILLENDDIEGVAKSMLKLLNNPEDTLEMGIKAKQKVKENFTMSVVCKMWEDLFIDIFIEKEIKGAINQIELRGNYNKLKKENKKISSENKKLKKENEDLSELKSDLLSSTSWKITKPLRKSREIFKK